MAAGPGGSVIVLESSDDERVPTEEEVNEYAEFLGLDPATEPHLLWIAKEGVVAQVPPPWKACTENGDDVFYFNFETGDSVWEHPSDEKYRQLVEDHRNKPPPSTSPAGKFDCGISDSVDNSAIVESLDNSLIDLPMDNLDNLLPSGASDKSLPSATSDLSKARGGALDLGPVNGLRAGAKTLPPLNGSLGAPLTPLGPLGGPGVGAAAPQGSGQAATSTSPEGKNRLELITNEISDDDAASDNSPRSPQGSPLGAGKSPGPACSPAPARSPADSERGSAGVGLAAVGGGLEVDTALDKSGEHSIGSSQSSPVAGSVSGAPSPSAGSGSGVPSQSGSRGGLPRGPSRGSTGSQNGQGGVLDRSGQSGKSSNLSNFSEVSEDFPSDFEKSEVLSPRGGGRASPLGDSLEVSATMEDFGAAAAADAAAASAVPGPLEGAAAATTSATSAISMTKFTETTTQSSKLSSTTSRMEKVQNDMASLTRALAKLREIRGQQKEYLSLLQGGG